jgi:hypothetical protein
MDPGRRSTAWPAYLLSLPERVVRSLAALSGGLLRELGTVALPASVRRTALYRTMVDVTLRFLIEEVGKVEGVYDPDPEMHQQLAEDFLLKRGASHGIEILGILAFNASPVWVLAALADIAGGSRTLIGEIAAALHEEGLLGTGHFETLEQVLEGLEKTSGRLAGTLNLPPVNVRGLRREWERLREAAQDIPPKNIPAVAAVERVWRHMQESAREQGLPVFAVSSLMAVSTVTHLPDRVLKLSRAARSAARRTGKVLGENILDHYTQTLADISRKGFGAYWAAEFRPYLRAAAEQFGPDRQSLTEKLLTRIQPRMNTNKHE